MDFTVLPLSPSMVEAIILEHKVNATASPPSLNIPLRTRQTYNQKNRWVFFKSDFSMILV